MNDRYERDAPITDDVRAFLHLVAIIQRRIDRLPQSTHQV